MCIRDRLKGILRTEFDAAGERAAKRMGGSFAESYGDAALAAKQYRALASAPPHAGKPFNWGAAGLGLLTHGPIGAGAGIALGLAKRWASERGLSTAAKMCIRDSSSTPPAAPSTPCAPPRRAA